MVETSEFEVISNAISKYERLSEDLDIAYNRTLIKRIATDASILKYSCEFGLWYFNLGQTYKHLKSFQDIDIPYQNLFRNYYELLEFLSVKISRLNKFIPFYKPKNGVTKDEITLKLNVVNKNCKSLVHKMKIFQKELHSINSQINHASLIANENKEIVVEKPHSNLVEEEKFFKKINITQLSHSDNEHKVMPITSILNNLKFEEEATATIDIFDKKSVQPSLEIIEKKKSIASSAKKIHNSILIENIDNDIKINEVVIKASIFNEKKKETEKKKEDSLLDFMRQSRSMPI